MSTIEGIRKVNENIIKDGRALIITDNTILGKDVPDGSLKINPLTGNMHIKKTNILDWSKLTPYNLFDELSIESDLLANGIIKEEKLNNSAVTTDKIKDASITSAKLDSNSILSDKIAEGAVTTDKIEDLNVTTDKIANLAITEEKLAEESIGASKIKNGSISQDKLDSLLTSKLGLLDVLTFNPTTKLIYSPDTNVNMKLEGNLTVTGDITGARVFNPHYADYAEAFENPNKINFIPGDIVCLNKEGKLDYAKIDSEFVLGVISDCYAQLNGASRSEIENKTKVAVGLMGKIPVTVVGKINLGDYIMPYKEGYGIKTSDKNRAIGRALESNSDKDIKKVLALII